MFKGVHISQRKWSLQKIMDKNIGFENQRHQFFVMLLKFVSVCAASRVRLIIENPWNTSRMTFLQTSFISPTIIDKNRALRGDIYVKPTAYWFIGCRPTHGRTIQPNVSPKIVYKEHGAHQATGHCDEQRSLISPDYARNFICDFILGKTQPGTELTLF